jgi:hypothetical protein
MDMRGWTALGVYLPETVCYGWDLVVLDSICDRLHLRRQTIHECLVQLSNPQKMAHTRLATATLEGKL